MGRTEPKLRARTVSERGEKVCQLACLHKARASVCVCVRVCLKKKMSKRFVYTLNLNRYKNDGFVVLRINSVDDTRIHWSMNDREELPTEITG